MVLRSDQPGRIRNRKEDANSSSLTVDSIAIEQQRKLHCIANRSCMKFSIHTLCQCSVMADTKIALQQLSNLAALINRKKRQVSVQSNADTIAKRVKNGAGQPCRSSHPVEKLGAEIVNLSARLLPAPRSRPSLPETKSQTQLCTFYLRDGTKTHHINFWSWANLIDWPICCMVARIAGVCRNGDVCTYKHDRTRVAVCMEFLRGQCEHKSCLLAHTTDVVHESRLPSSSQGHST